VSTNIAFLEQLREDLLDAAWRDSLPAGGRARSDRPIRPHRGRWVIAIAAVFGLLAVSGIGFLAIGTEGASRRFDLPVAGGDEGGAGGAARLVPSSAPRETAEQYSAIPGVAQHRAALADDSPGIVREQAATRDVSIGDLALVVKTGKLAIVVERDSFATRMQDAMDVATSNDGYVQTSATQGDRFGSLVIRVPADRFETAVRELKELGTRVESESVSGDDVTAEYVDLRARLHIAKARRTVLERLMNKAVSIEQTIRVQNALDDVQLRIEEYQGSLNVLEDKVSEATIRVQIREPGAQPLEEDARNPSLPGAFDRAIAGFFSVIAGTIVGLGYLIPLLVIGVALFFGVRLARRRLA
jgi:hypothetical protein